MCVCVCVVYKPCEMVVHCAPMQKVENRNINDAKCCLSTFRYRIFPISTILNSHSARSFFLLCVFPLRAHFMLLLLFPAAFFFFIVSSCVCLILSIYLGRALICLYVARALLLLFKLLEKSPGYECVPGARVHTTNTQNASPAKIFCCYSNTPAHTLPLSTLHILCTWPVPQPMQHGKRVRVRPMSVYNYFCCVLCVCCVMFFYCHRRRLSLSCSLYLSVLGVYGMRHSSCSTSTVLSSGVCSWLPSTIYTPK